MINILRENITHLTNKFLFATKPGILKNFHFKLHKAQNLKRKAINHLIFFHQNEKLTILLNVVVSARCPSPEHRPRADPRPRGAPPDLPAATA